MCSAHEKAPKRRRSVEHVQTQRLRGPYQTTYALCARPHVEQRPRPCCTLPRLSFLDFASYSYPRYQFRLPLSGPPKELPFNMNFDDVEERDGL
jgi:hypothetical protein